MNRAINRSAAGGLKAPVELLADHLGDHLHQEKCEGDEQDRCEDKRDERRVAELADESEREQTTDESRDEADRSRLTNGRRKGDGMMGCG